VYRAHGVRNGLRKAVILYRLHLERFPTLKRLANLAGSSTDPLV
jgi:hypothetical protein